MFWQDQENHVLNAVMLNISVLLKDIAIHVMSMFQGMLQANIGIKNMM